MKKTTEPTKAVDHNHETCVLMPPGECPGCDQSRTKTRDPSKAARARTLRERFDDACKGIKAALRTRGLPDAHDDRLGAPHDRLRRQWFVGESERSRIALEQKAPSARNPNAEKQLAIVVQSWKPRDCYRAERDATVPFKPRKDGTFNYQGAVDLALEWAKKRDAEVKARDDEKAAREAEDAIEERELCPLDQRARSKGTSFATRNKGWVAVRRRGQDEDAKDPIYLFGIPESLVVPLSVVRKVAKILGDATAAGEAKVTHVVDPCGKHAVAYGGYDQGNPVSETMYEGPCKHRKGHPGSCRPADPNDARTPDEIRAEIARSREEKP